MALMENPSSSRQAGAEHTARAAAAPSHSAIVPIREIGARYREAIARHLLALDAHDRYLRFGYAANERQIRQYVDKLDFSRDHVFGIFNRRLDLVAVAHLAFPAVMTEAGFAEFGVSVAAHARGRGYGARLFERAAIHAVNSGVKTLYIHALTENTPMLRIARKAGAVVERAGSESEAHLALPEASFKTRVGELLADQVGQVDYWLKSERKQLRDWVGGTRQAHDAVREGRHGPGR
ncbi:MAG: GNAT family N-acetyltransferase [Pseudomonadota bacterium]|nr:GNAT family N-acetyltransferase [Pseudomonadota bacterium]